MDQRQRGYAVGQVVAETFAGLTGRRIVIQRIVDELERSAQMTAVSRQRILDGARLVSEDAADQRRCFE